MQSFVIFQIAVKEWVFVILFNFQCDRSCRKSRNMIDLMGNRLPLNPVDCPLDHELMLAPAVIVQGSPESLGAFGLAPARTDDLLYRYGRCRQDSLKLKGNLTEVHAQDRLGMGVEFNLETSGMKRFEHALSITRSHGLSSASPQLGMPPNSCR